VTLEQALEEARKLYPGLKLTPATARVWAHRGLIPKAEAAPGQGMGRGRVGDYSSDVPAQVAAAGFVKQGLRRRFKDADIARARQFWISGGKALGEEAEELLPGLLAAAMYRERWFGIYEAESLHKALDVLIYASRLEMARRGMDVSETVKAEFQLVFSEDYPRVSLFMKSIEPYHRDEIIVTARDISGRFLYKGGESVV